MSRTRIKICGLTRVEHVEWANRLGVDAIGLVFYPNSARFVSVEAASDLSTAAAPFVTVTGLFMNAGSDEVEAILREVTIDLLQFHGEETAEFCESFNRPYIKAVPMGGGSIDEKFVSDYVNSHPCARGFLLDSNAVGQAGGSGETFDWGKIPSLQKPLVLAGGISATNVSTAVKTVKPYGVDVSSGVEVNKGEKNHALMKQFVQEVRVVDQHIHKQ